MRGSILHVSALALICLVLIPELLLAAQENKPDNNIVYDPMLYEHLEYRCIGPSRG